MAPDEKADILYLNHVSGMSGAEASLLSLLTHLDTRSFRPIVGLPEPGPFMDRLRTADIETAVIQHPRLHRSHNPFALVAQYLALRRGAGRVADFAADHDIRLIHANSLSSAISAGRAVDAETALVYHARDLRLPAAATRWVVRRADAVIAISRAVARRLTEVAPRASTKTSIIPNGIDADAWAPRSSRGRILQELGLPEDTVLVGGTGQLVPWKNWPAFLRAGAEIAARMRNAHLLIVGDDIFRDHPGYREELEQMADGLAIRRRTHFLGYREDVADIVSALNVFVHCAEEEPLGRAVMEAMSLERPVVAVGAAGPAELIQDGETGLLAPPKNAYAIAKRVVEVLQDPALAGRLGKAARARIEATYRPEHTARLTEQLYREVLWRRPSYEPGSGGG